MKYRNLLLVVVLGAVSYTKFAGAITSLKVEYLTVSDQEDSIYEAKLSNTLDRHITCNLTFKVGIESGFGEVSTLEYTREKVEFPPAEQVVISHDFYEDLEKHRKFDLSWDFQGLETFSVESGCDSDLTMDPSNGALRVYKSDDKYQYTWSQWCKGEVPNINIAERFLVHHIYLTLKYSGKNHGFGREVTDCNKQQSLLHNYLGEFGFRIVEHEAFLKNYTDISPLISFRFARKLRLISIYRANFSNAEIAKLDFLRDVSRGNAVWIRIPSKDADGLDSVCPHDDKETVWCDKL